MSAGEEESGEVKHKAIWDEVSTDRVAGFKLTASSNSKGAKDSGYIFPPNFADKITMDGQTVG